MQLSQSMFRVLILLVVVNWATLTKVNSAEAIHPAISAENLQEFNQFVQSALQESGVPGVSIAIVKDGKVVLTAGYGVKNIDNQSPVDENTLFAIASNTKAFTAAAMGMLVDRQQLNWDDKVVDHLNYYQLYDSYASQNMRIDDILSHRLGYKVYSGDLLWYDTQYSPEEIIKRSRFVKPASQFRYNFGYSNMGYITAGEVIAKTAGKSWEDFIQQEIFKPLGMSNSATSLKRVKNTKRLASPHLEYLTEDNQVAFEAMDWHHNEAIGAAGSIITSAKDITHWLQLQLNQGSYKKHQLFNQSISNTMWTAHSNIPTSPRLDKSDSHLAAYGLGWFLKDYHGRLVVTHSGSVAGMTSRITLIPQEKLGIAVFTNSTAPLYNVINDKIVASFLQLSSSIEPEAIFAQHRENFREKIASRKAALGTVITGTHPSHELAAYTGTYRSEMYGDVLVSLRQFNNSQQPQLKIEFKPSPMLTGKLVHRHYDVFTIQWNAKRAWINEGTALFESDSLGAINQLKFNVPNDDIWFDEPQFFKVVEK